MSDINVTRTIYVDAQPVTPVNKPSSVHENAGLNVNAPEPAQQSAPAYEDVVAVSKDGDTVQAKPESYERLSDGFVFTKSKETTTEDNSDEVKASSQAAEQKAADEHVRESSEMRDERKEARIKEAIRESQERASQAKDILQDQIEEKATDTKAAAIKNYGYPVFVRIKGANGNPVDSNTCEYLIPTIETVKIPVHQKQKYPSGYNTGYSAYKYVAIDAKTESDGVHDTVVAVWYDGTNCRYAYNDNPTSGKDNGSAGGWKGNKIIFTEGGEHCTVKFDSEGGVHIAAYVDGSLRYAYLSSADAAYNEATDSVKVDSFTITGERITLDTGKDEAGRIIPYISYFNGTARLPAVAKLIAPASGAVNYKAQGTGTDDGEDVFTGNWEISLVPSPKTLTTNYYDKMNICLWKQNGVIVRGDNANFTISKSKKTNDNSSNGTNGDIYGNGTANPILGYAVESTSGTCLETAQMK